MPPLRGSKRAALRLTRTQMYCYHHHIKHTNRKNYRVLIDPDITCMEIPVIEERASIFIALAAVIHRLADNTIDTRRAGKMIYGLQVAMPALEPPLSQRCSVSQPQSTAAHSNKSCHPERTQRAEGPRGTAPAKTVDTARPPDPPAPATIPITKESLLYSLRSRHCASCNAELFPADELTERPHPGAPSQIIEESIRCLPAQGTSPAILSTLIAVASNPGPETPNRETWYREPVPQSTFAARFALHSPRRSVSLRLGLRALCIPASSSVRPHRI